MTAKERVLERYPGAVASADAWCAAGWLFRKWVILAESILGRQVSDDCRTEDAAWASAARRLDQQRG